MRLGDLFHNLHLAEWMSGFTAAKSGGFQQEKRQIQDAQLFSCIIFAICDV
jgi:hypothetical protein